MCMSRTVSLAAHCELPLRCKNHIGSLSVHHRGPIINNRYWHNCEPIYVQNEIETDFGSQYCTNIHVFPQRTPVQVSDHQMKYRGRRGKKKLISTNWLVEFDRGATWSPYYFGCMLSIYRFRSYTCSGICVQDVAKTKTKGKDKRECGFHCERVIIQRKE